LEEGKIVITDRYYFSSMAYQGALGLDPMDIQRLNADFAPPPDLVIILELPLDEIARRLQQRGSPVSQSFEKIDYLARVAAIFDRLEGPGLIRVDGSGSEAAVQTRIQTLVSRFLNLPARSPGPRTKIVREEA
jgi:dTMP kinase